MRSRAGWLLAVVIAVVATAVVFGLRAAGPPSEVRRAAIDARRVEDLRELAGVLVEETRRGAAPTDSAFRALCGSLPEHARDPVRGEPYRFRRLAGQGFELGARFDTARRPQDLESYERRWEHGAGEWWFVFSKDGLTPDRGHAGP